MLSRQKEIGDGAEGVGGPAERPKLSLSVGDKVSGELT